VAGFRKMLDDDGFSQRRHYSVASSNSDGLGDRLPLMWRIAPLHHADRVERLQRTKAIGRIAYRIARAANGYVSFFSG
jgi:hypothetical protein